MGLSTESYIADGIQKTFQVSNDILSASHCRVHFTYNGVDHPQVDSSWDLVGRATVVFVTAPTSGYVVHITISSDGSGLDAAPSVLSTVVVNMEEILLADDNALIATTKAAEATVSATEAAASATAAGNSASSATTSAANASASESSASGDATQTALDRIATAADALQTASDKTSSSTSATTASSASVSATASATSAATSATTATTKASTASAYALTAENKASEASTYSTTSQLKAWEAEAEKMTADSYATEAEDVLVKTYTSDGDGTFTATPITEYSAFHWKSKTEAIAVGAVEVAGLAGSIGSLTTPLLDLPLNNNLSMKQGTGAVTFSRATTGTYVDRYGVLKYSAIDEPRFEKDGLLIEGASTNLLLNSNDTSQSSVWDGTVEGFFTNTYNSTDISSPDNSSNSTKHVGTTTYYLWKRQAVPISAGTYTASVWVYIPSGQGITSFGMKIDIQDSEVGSVMDTAVFDKWVRLESLVTTSASRTFMDFNIRTNGADVGFTGLTFYSFGFQLEELPFASSYIPTTTSAVTRSADDCSVDYRNNLSDIMKDFSVTAEFCVFGHGLANHQALFFSDDTYFGYYIKTRLSSGEVSQFFKGNSDLGGLVKALETLYRIAITSDGSSDYVYIDGELEGSQEVLDTLTIGDRSKITIGSLGGSHILYGHIKNFKIYDKALTATEVALS